MHYRNKSSHYIVSAAEADELRRQCALGDHLHEEIKRWRQSQGLRPYTNADLKVNTALLTSARGDDDDSRQIIADLISDDRSPFTPEDEMALRNLSTPTLRQMRGRYLNKYTWKGDEVEWSKTEVNPVANASDPAFNAMSAGVNGLAGADFHARANARKRMSDEYIRRNPVQRSQRAAPVNDPAVRAMSEHSGGLLAHYGRGK